MADCAETDRPSHYPIDSPHDRGHWLDLERLALLRHNPSCVARGESSQPSPGGYPELHLFSKIEGVSPLRKYAPNVADPGPITDGGFGRVPGAFPWPHSGTSQNHFWGVYWHMRLRASEGLRLQYI